MSLVQDLVLARFLTLYGEPKTDCLEAFIGEYESALTGYAPDVLRGAADRVIRDQEFRSWPTPGECVKACESAAFALEDARRRQETPAALDRTPWPEPTAEQKAAVRAMAEDAKRAILSNDKPEPPRRSLSDISKRMTGEANGGG